MKIHNGLLFKNLVEIFLVYREGKRIAVMQRFKKHTFDKIRLIVTFSKLLLNLYNKFLTVENSASLRTRTPEQ